MATISQEKDLEMLKKNADGTYTKYNPVTKAKNVKLTNGQDVELQLGDITTLKTTDKTSLVKAVNELFTNVDNGKNNVYSAIVGKGTTPVSKDFADLVLGINAISTGKKWAKGEVKVGTDYFITITGLNFLPSIVILRNEFNGGNCKVYYQFDASHNILIYYAGAVWEKIKADEYVINGGFKFSLSSGITQWIAVE